MKTLTALGTMLAIVALLAPAASAQNLLTNPGFEDNGGSYDGWFTFGSGPNISTAGTDNIFYSGSAAAKIFGEFTGCPFPTFDVGGFGQSFTPTPGKTYTFSGFSFVSSADTIPGEIVCESNRAIAKIAFFDAATGGTELASNEFVVGGPNTPLDQWIPFEVSAPAPAGAQRVEALILYLQPGCDEGSVFVDETSFVESDPPALPTNLVTNPSFDGASNAGWDTFGNTPTEGRNTLVRTPTGSQKLFGTFVEGNDSGITQTIAITGGQNYELSAYVLTTCLEDAITGGNNNIVQALIEYRDAGGNLLSTAEATILDNSTPLGTWTKKSITGEAPELAVTADIYFLFVSPILEGGAMWLDDVYFGEATATNAPAADRGIALEQNTPNPFNPSTTIHFTLERAGDVSLRVFDAKGRLVTTLAERSYDAGRHAVTWDGRSGDGRPVASGVYHYVLDTAAGREARAMVLLK